MQFIGKRSAGVALFAAGALVLSGCAGGGDPNNGENGASSDTVIRIASAETADSAIRAMQEAGDRYTAETGVRVVVEAVPLSDIYTKVNSVYGTRAAYSAFLTGFAGHVQLLQAEDKVIPVDGIIEDLGGVEDFFDGHILFPIDGQTYWVPFDYNLAFGIVRSDWLAEVGKEIPTTWEELLDVAEALDGYKPDGSGIMMPLRADDSSNWITSQVLWANEVEIFDDEWNVILDEGGMGERTTESLELLAELYQYMPTRADNASYGDMLETFIGEQVGMSFYTGRMFDNIIAQNPSIIDDVEIFGFPMRSGEGVTASLGYDGLAILNTDHNDATTDFVRWWFQNELIGLYATAPLHYQPAQRSILEREDWLALPTIAEHGDRLMTPLVDMVENAHLHSIDSDGPYPDVRAGRAFQSMVFPEAYQRVTLGGQPAAEVTSWLGDAVRNAIQ